MPQPAAFSARMNPNIAADPAPLAPGSARAQSARQPAPYRLACVPPFARGPVFAGPPGQATGLVPLRGFTVAGQCRDTLLNVAGQTFADRTSLGWRPPQETLGHG